MATEWKRRSVLASGAALGLVGRSRRAHAASRVRIGVLSDMSGPYSANAGQGSVIGARLAIEDFKRDNPGMDIDLIEGDFQNKADIGSALARDWMDTKGVTALWHYMQGGPGVFRGDPHFYKGEGDLRGELGLIDTAKCPVWLLTGDYDYSCPPDATREAACGIPGASVGIMERLGHFPMSENYPLFRTHLLPVLDQLLQSIALGG